MSKAPSSDAGPLRRWARRLLVIAGVLALLLLAGWARVATLPRPDFASAARPLGARDRGVPLPVLLTPQSDIAGGNALVCAFVARRGPGTTEITFVWEDEDQPTCGLFDLVYDLYRSWEFGRVMDVETVYYRHDPEAVEDGDLRPREIDLPGVFAREQPFDVPFARHYDATFPRVRFEELSGRPVLRVATWNHELTPGAAGDPSAGGVGEGFPRAGQEPPSKREGLAVTSEYPVYEGTRADVEALFAAAREGRQ